MLSFLPIGTQTKCKHECLCQTSDHDAHIFAKKSLLFEPRHFDFLFLSHPSTAAATAAAPSTRATEERLPMATTDVDL